MHLDTGLLALIFVILALLVGAAARIAAKLAHLPYSVSLLLLGLGLGLAQRIDVVALNSPLFSSAIDSLSNVDPHLILFLFLPTLIFESAFALETHLFKRIFSQIAILAVPGLIMAAGLTAVLAYLVFPWSWSWPVCFLFGALISATDPVAVVALLKEVSSRKRLETLIEGESLLNDGTAIVFFTLFYGLVVATADVSVNLLLIASEFIWVVVLGLAIGLAGGGLVLLWISRVFNDPLIEITLTISAAYLVYFVAENLLHVSGIVAVVALAILFASVGRTRISPEVAGFLHNFWEMMAHIANTLIFLLVGIIIATRIRLDVMEWWITLLVLYLGIQIIRSLCVFTFMPVLKRIGVGITKEKAIVLVWGGLRGAVSLALALIVAQDPNLPKALGDQILFLTAGIVVLTITINATTMGMVLKYLGMDRLPAAKQATVQKAKASISEGMNKALPELQQDEFMQRADWANLTKRFSYAVNNHPKAEDSDVNIAFRRRILETERKYYWTQFSNGALPGATANKLVEAVEQSLDGEPTITPRPSLYRLWQTPKILEYLGRYPGINKVALNLSFERLALGYDVARGFIQAQQEIAQHVSQLAPNKTELDAVIEEIETNKKETRNRINQLRDSFPEVVYCLETHTASRLMLNMERSKIKNLVDDGVLDASEAEKMIVDVEKQLAVLRHQPKVASPTEFGKQLIIAPWVQGLNKKTLEKLAKITVRQIYSSGDVIIRQHKKGNAIAVIIRGNVQVLSTKREAVLEPGSTLGLFAILSGSYKESAKALSPVDLLWVDITRLKGIIDLDPLLAERIADLVQAESH